PKTALDVPLTRSPTPGASINYAVINDSGNWRQYTPGASINYAVINDSGNWRQYTAILEKYISESDFTPEF
ncbi:hypothetical protein N4R04_01205, partial [Salmonella enterica subsp. enterica serovar Pomona]